MKPTGNATESEVPSRAAISVSTASVKNASIPRRPSSKFSLLFSFPHSFLSVSWALVVEVMEVLNEGIRRFSDRNDERVEGILGHKLHQAPNVTGRIKQEHLGHVLIFMLASKSDPGTDASAFGYV